MLSTEFPCKGQNVSAPSCWLAEPRPSPRLPAGLETGCTDPPWGCVRDCRAELPQCWAAGCGSCLISGREGRGCCCGGKAVKKPRCKALESQCSEPKSECSALLLPLSSCATDSPGCSKPSFKCFVPEFSSWHKVLLCAGCKSLSRSADIWDALQFLLKGILERK